MLIFFSFHHMEVANNQPTVCLSRTIGIDMARFI